MIYWLKVLLGIDIAESSIQGLIARANDIDTRLDHVANRVTRLEIDTNEVEKYVYPQKHRK